MKEIRLGGENRFKHIVGRKIYNLCIYAGVAILMVLSALIVRLYVFEIYKIPSSSMYPTLESGDYIIVNKISYGSRVVNIWKFITENKLEYVWYKGLGGVKKEDVFAFNFPQYWTLNDKDGNMYGDIMVKRCIGMPNGIVRIKKNDAYLNNGFANKFDLYPHDSKLSWTIDNYGPLWIPGKGKRLNLSAKNVKHYQDVLLYDGYKAVMSNDTVLNTAGFANYYTFKNNYYFMLGDNFYDSHDSRYWGFVPEKNIIGKAELVLFSLAPDEPWYKCFRISRFLKRIN